MTTVRLRGGRFDGLVGDVSRAVIEVGFLPICECPRHGVQPEGCACGDAVWFAYHAEPGSGAGQFVEVTDPYD
jgi:hypothetical protein